MLVAREPVAEELNQVFEPQPVVRYRGDRDRHLAPLFVRAADDGDFNDAGMVG
ncbi:Uncharacterised protein [Mycobacterium tuberculosis]|nr:Uncharacterised protein [Mycobacterium tuberculosis]